jgi:hypothetical protein
MITFARVKRGEGPGNNTLRHWTPRHTAIVMDRISGMTISQIAERYNLIDSHISQICNTKQARKLIAEVNQRVLGEKYDNLTDETKSMMILAAQRLKDFLKNDELQTKAPLACVDPNVKIFNALASMNKNPVVQTGNTYNINTSNTQVNVMSDPAKRDKLAAGLAEARLVEEIHADIVADSFDGTAQIDYIPK